MTENTRPDIPSDLTFPETGDLTALQSHLARLCAHFGWETNAEKKFLLLVEEVGELAKAIRKQERLFTETGKPAETAAAIHQNLQDEFADVFSYLMDLANQYDIDLGQAYTAKMSANFSRQWE